jgi:hypothetical protein
MLMRVWGKRNAYILLVGIQAIVWKTECMFVKELKIDLPYDLAIPLLGTYPKQMNSISYVTEYYFSHKKGEILSFAAT